MLQRLLGPLLRVAGAEGRLRGALPGSQGFPRLRNGHLETGSRAHCTHVDNSDRGRSVPGRGHLVDWDVVPCG